MLSNQAAKFIREQTAGSNLPIEAYLIPRSPISSVTPSIRAAAVDAAISAARACRSKRHISRAISAADQSEEKANNTPTSGDINDALRSFRRVSADWLQDVDESIRENIYSLLVLSLTGRVSSTEFRHAVREAKKLRSADEVRMDNDHKSLASYVNVIRDGF